LFKLLNKKKEFTQNDGAWLQYEHLADWLIEIASILKIKGTSYEDEFCEIARYSLRKSSRKLYKGYSWRAWTTWKSRWHEMKIENQHMLEDLIKNNTWTTYLEIPEIIK